MDGSEDCLNRWNKEHWELTNTMRTPMDPVFDQRWEGNIFVTPKTIKVFINATEIFIYAYSYFTAREWKDKALLSDRR